MNVKDTELVTLWNVLEYTRDMIDERDRTASEHEYECIEALHQRAEERLDALVAAGTINPDWKVAR